MPRWRAFTLVWLGCIVACLADCTRDGVWGPTSPNSLVSIPCGNPNPGSRTRLCDATSQWQTENNTCGVCATCCPDDGDWFEIASGTMFTLHNECPNATDLGDRSRQCIGGAWQPEDVQCYPIGTTRAPTNAPLGCARLGVYPPAAHNTRQVLLCANDTGSVDRSRVCFNGVYGPETNNCPPCAPTACCPDDGDWFARKSGFSYQLNECPVGTEGSRTRQCVNGVWGTESNQCIASKAPTVFGETNYPTKAPSPGGPAQGIWGSAAPDTQAQLQCPNPAGGGVRQRLCTQTGWEAETSTCAPCPTCCPDDGEWFSILPLQMATKRDCAGGLQYSRNRTCLSSGWQAVVSNCPTNAPTETPTVVGQTRAPTHAPTTNIPTLAPTYTMCPRNGVWPALGPGIWQLPCGAGRNNGTRNRTCSLLGAWGTEQNSCDPCPQCCPDDGEWFQIPFNTRSSHNCTPPLVGEQSRDCLAAGWQPATETCVDPANPPSPTTRSPTNPPGVAPTRAPTESPTRLPTTTDQTEAPTVASVPSEELTVFGFNLPNVDAGTTYGILGAILVTLIFCCVVFAVRKKRGGFGRNKHRLEMSEL